MFRFLFGVLVGAAGYWAWQSFGRDLVGIGADQGAMSYSGYGGSNNTASTASGASYSGSSSTQGTGASETPAAS